MTANLRFSPIYERPPCTLADLLRQSYAPLLRDDPARWIPESARWHEFDQSAYSTPAIASCVFLTWREETLIGFGSFDPRGAPESARIGHNCIVPAAQRQGCGQKQLAEILRRLDALGVGAVDAVTLDLPFFTPAQRMYRSAGFQIVARARRSSDPSADQLHLRMAGRTSARRRQTAALRNPSAD
jgi:RimJ/RimL family protein N-acetyltransferase